MRLLTNYGNCSPQSTLTLGNPLVAAKLTAECRGGEAEVIRYTGDFREWSERVTGGTSTLVDRSRVPTPTLFFFLRPVNFFLQSLRLFYHLLFIVTDSDCLSSFPYLSFVTRLLLLNKEGQRNTITKMATYALSQSHREVRAGSNAIGMQMRRWY